MGISNRAVGVRAITVFLAVLIAFNFLRVSPERALLVSLICASSVVLNAKIPRFHFLWLCLGIFLASAIMSTALSDPLPILIPGAITAILLGLTLWLFEPSGIGEHWFRRILHRGE